MKSNLFLPDTSAILTMMDNEEGADIVENILRTKKIIFPAMVLFEVYYKTIQYQGLEAAQLRYATLKSIKANHISKLTEPVLLKGGEIKAAHQISLADSIIVAHAIIYNATLVHKDPEFEIITIVDQIKLPFKHRLEKK